MKNDVVIRFNYTRSMSEYSVTVKHDSGNPSLYSWYREARYVSTHTHVVSTQTYTHEDLRIHIHMRISAYTVQWFRYKSCQTSKQTNNIHSKSGICYIQKHYYMYAMLTLINEIGMETFVQNELEFQTNQWKLLKMHLN